MTSQTPAQGVLLVKDWGTSKMYKAVCECGDNDCTHTIDVEAEDTGVVVTIYTTTRTNFWSKSRWHHIWRLLTKGYTDYETCIIMPKQVALNYADVLQLAVKDVEELRNKQNGKIKSS
jgi:hypothetical protein